MFTSNISSLASVNTLRKLEKVVSLFPGVHVGGKSKERQGAGLSDLLPGQGSEFKSRLFREWNVLIGAEKTCLAYLEKRRWECPKHAY